MNRKQKASVLFTTFFETVRTLDNIKRPSYQVLKLVINLVKSLDLNNLNKLNNDTPPYFIDFLEYWNLACIESIKINKLEITQFLLNKFKEIYRLVSQKNQELLNMYESNQLVYNTK